MVCSVCSSITVECGLKYLRQRCDGERPACGQCVRAERAEDCEYLDGPGPTQNQLLEGEIARLEGQIARLSAGSAPVVTPEVHARVMREIIGPTVHGMDQEGMPFTGFLYAGLMIDAAGRPRTLEFNTRMGDPEAQRDPLVALLHLMDQRHAFDDRMGRAMAFLFRC